jgi:hypothetical protein
MKCDWYSCKNEAEYRFAPANAVFCKDHLEINALRFGCASIITDATPIKKEENQRESNEEKSPCEAEVSNYLMTKTSLHVVHVVDIEQIIRKHIAALTAPPHVPQDTHPLTEVREALAFYANKKTTTQEIYMEGGKAAIKALATLDRVIEGDGWLPIETRPKEETFSYLVFVPKTQSTDDYDVALQVSNFQGEMYPDHMQNLVDWEDAVKNPTHWRPLPNPPEEK